MLLTDTSKTLYRNLRSRWSLLDNWLDAHPDAAAHIQPSIKVFRDNWKQIDSFILTNPDDLQSACLDMDTAENYAVEHGYTLPSDDPSFWNKWVTGSGTGPGAAHGSCPSPERMAQEAHPIVYATGQQAEDYCKTHPDSVTCSVTSPKPLTGKDAPSWCQRLGANPLVCDQNGLKDWFTWTLGLAGAATLVGLGYVAVKAAEIAAPVALSVYAPEALPLYRAARQGAPEHVLAAVDAEQGRYHG